MPKFFLESRALLFPFTPYVTCQIQINLHFKIYYMKIFVRPQFTNGQNVISEFKKLESPVAGCLLLLFVGKHCADDHLQNVVRDTRLMHWNGIETRMRERSVCVCVCVSTHMGSLPKGRKRIGMIFTLFKRRPRLIDKNLKKEKLFRCENGNNNVSENGDESIVLLYKFG